MFKPEFQQETYFKIRGALNAIISLSDEERARGVATASSGNHGPALACAASKFQILRQRFFCRIWSLKISDKM